MSRPMPAAFDSAISMMTTSASSFSAIWRATVAPTFPAPPTTVTLRFMNLLRRERLVATNDEPIRSCHRSRRRSYSQFLLKTLLKRSALCPRSPTDPEQFSGLHNRSATVTATIHGGTENTEDLGIPRSSLCLLGSRSQPQIILGKTSTRSDASSRTPTLKIVIADDLPSSALDLLRAEGWTVDARTGRAPEQLSADLADADAIVVRSATKVTGALIHGAPKLRAIARAGT